MYINNYHSHLTKSAPTRVLNMRELVAVPDLGKPGHCPGKIVDIAYEKLNCDIAAPPRMPPARVTWQL